jgi:hypothetical protein
MIDAELTGFSPAMDRSGIVGVYEFSATPVTALPLIIFGGP